MTIQKETELDKKFEAARNRLLQKSILEVAQALGMNFNGNEWTEHDSFKIDFKKNRASWYSKGEDYRNMNVFDLVMKMRNVSYREAYQFVKTGDFKQLEIKHKPKEPFEYKLKPYEDTTFSEARAYLKNERQLSDETIDFFIEQEVLVQSTRRTNVSDVPEMDGKYYYDPVIVFKALNRDKTIVGTSLVGIGEKSVYELPGSSVKRKQIGYNSDGLGGTNISIGNPNRIVVMEAPIDMMSYYELHKDNLNDVMLIALDGASSKIPSIKRYVMDILTEGNWSLNPDRSKLKDQFEMVLENTDTFKNRPDFITVAVDNDRAGKEMVDNLKKQNIPIVVDLPPLHDGQTKNDWNDELKYVKASKAVVTTQKEFSDDYSIKSENKKALEQSQELKSPIGGTFNRNPSSLDSLSAKVAPQPVEQAQPNFLTDDLLHFTINDSKIKVRKNGYYPIKPNELRKLNLIAPSLQQTAKFYMQQLSGTTINYVYKDGSNYSKMAVKFEDENFMHLTGIMPYISNSPRTASQTLKDFAEGKGDFDNILVSAAFKDKLMVLPLISEIVDSKSFLLDDLSEVQKFKRLQLDKAIKTEDEELLVAFRDVEGIGMPASVIKLKPNSNLKLQMDEYIEDKTILGVFRDYDSEVDILSVNDDFIKDGGKELKTILENGEFENIVSEDVRKEESNKANPIDTNGVGFLIAQNMKADAEDEGFIFGNADQVMLPMYLFPNGEMLDGMTTWARDEVIGAGYEASRDLDHYVISSYIPESLIESDADNKISNFDKLDIIRLVPESKVAILPNENITSEQLEALREFEPVTIVQSWDDKEFTLEEFESKGATVESKVDIVEDIEEEQVFSLEPNQNVIDAARAKDTKALSVHLKEGVKQYLNSDKYKHFLNAMSKFHRYSPRNIQMILAQKPDARLIAPAGRWKSEFERFPKKGSKAIYTWDYREKLDKDKDGNIIKDDKGHPKKVSYFVLAPKGNSKSFFRSPDKDVLVHHLTQSFSPDDNLTPEEIHEIGRKTAIEFLGGDHEFVIATHVDQKHIHNHIIFNSTNQRTLKKFEWHAKKTYNAYRHISDKHAAMAGAYIIKPETRRLKQYGSYHREINFKDEIKSRVDFLLRHSISLGDFEKKALALNLDVDWSGKHTTYKLLDYDQKKSTRARSLVRRSEPSKYNLEQIYDVTKRNDGVVLSTSEIKAAYDDEQKILQEEFQLRFTLEPWQVDAQTDEGVYVNLEYGRGKQGTVLIPSRSLEQDEETLEVFINKNDFFYFINPDNSRDNRYMTGATIAKQLTNENATPLIKKNSHISNIHRLVEQYNFLSANGVTSGTQLDDLLDEFNKELDETEQALNQLDERLARQKQISKALLALKSNEPFEQELAQKLLSSLNTPEQLTYEKSEMLADQIEIETEALRDRYENVLDKFDRISGINNEYKTSKTNGDKNIEHI